MAVMKPRTGEPVETAESAKPAFWAIDSDGLRERLGTTDGGLPAVVASERLTVSRRLASHHPTAWSLLVEQFCSPIMLLLLATAVLSYLLDDAMNAGIILGILIASGLLGFWQEWSAADAVAKLLAVIESRTTVVRDGIETEIPLDDVVAGDLVRLRAGDLIPGDCRLLSSRDLFVNEAALTGESFPVEKSPGVLPAVTRLAQRLNVLYLGTHVVSGLATAVVVMTGAETEFGRISSRLNTRPPETGFERGLRQFGHLLIRVVVLFTTGVFLVNVALQKPVIESLLFALALAVGMTPQLLPAVTSVVLATGAKAMAQQKVIVKQLLAIENLGSMTVLCCDKTGTLTEGEIRLEGALDLAGRSSERVLNLAYLNAAFQTGFANPIDRAIKSDHSVSTAGCEKLDEIPYDFSRKRLTVLIRHAGERRLITKGALSNILECCSQAETSDGGIVPLNDVRADIESRFAALSADGLRVLGVATRVVSSDTIDRPDERELTFAGFLVFADPLKPDVSETLAALRELGVGLKIITGDNRAVATAISQRAGLVAPTIVSGSELRGQSEPDLIRAAQAADVFAEVEPNQKEQIILALRRAGHVVGYLGDGINDASALHAADVGISVAQAVEVAREAAQVVLLERDLNVLVRGVREGRRTFANTLKYVFVAISANFGYMFSLACASLFLPFLPLLPSQILLVNLLADFPAMALATDSVDSEQIHRPRRWDVRFIARFMLSFGFSSSLFDFLTFGLILWLFGRDEATFHTGWFVESVLTGLMIMLIVRTQRPFFLSRPGGLFLATVAAIAVITVWLPYSPFAEALGFVAPSGKLLAVVFLITWLYGGGMELVKRLFYRRLVPNLN
jgi:Mg2+-importing ATPase